MMKIILLQLPLQGHDFFYSRENIPLAAAYLQTIAASEGFDCELLPEPLMSYGSDQAILRYLMDARPNIIGMSCYEWNVERSLFMARRLRQQCPDCRVTLGGPEITQKNPFLLSHPDFDVGVVGEGEGVWKQLLQAFPGTPDIPGLLLPLANGHWRFTGVNRIPWPPEDLTSPFLKDSLFTHLDEVLWLETVRGCAQRCAYCYYPKQFRGLKHFPLQPILDDIREASNKGIKEIVFLDPCFLSRPGIEVLLEGLAAVNQDHHLRFRAECNAEDADPAKAESLAKAGFTHLEVGLQSIKTATLRRIHRRLRPRQFLEGIHRLQQAGVEVMVDIIAGLPGDTLEDIQASLDWVMEHEAYDVLMLYALSLLPETELHERAGELGLEAMSHPPYLLTRNPTLRAQEMVDAFRYYEKCMGVEVSPLEVPVALDPGARDKHASDRLAQVETWATLDDVDGFTRRKEQVPYGLTLGVSKEILGQPSAWAGTVLDYLKANPFALLAVEVPGDVYPEQLDPLWQVARGHRHFIDRDYTVTHSPYRSFLVFSRHRDLIWKWPDPREADPVVLPDGQAIPCHPVCSVAGREEALPQWFTDHMADRYSSPPEIRVWQPPKETT
jgi:radical SAM superfamily enzyme YgiQ (UPF0313 family)